MKKLYAFLTAALACVGAFNANAYKVTVQVDNPAAVQATMGSQTVTFTDGVAEIEFTGYNYLDLQTVSPYVFDTVYTKYASSDDWYSGYIGSPTYYSIYLSEYADGDQYKFTTASLEDLRTASVTLNVDDPSAIEFQYSWSNEKFTPTEQHTVVKYVPGKETPFNITSKDGNPLYKVTLNGQ